jgi:hypothetical protein
VYLVPLYPFLALYLVWIAECAFFHRGETAGGPSLSGRRYRTAFLILAAAGLLSWGLAIVVHPMREHFYARAEFYQRVDQLSAGRPVMIAGLGIHEAVWYLDRPMEAIEKCSHTELAEGFMPPPNRVLVVPQAFLERHPELQEKFVVLDATLRRGDTVFAVVVAK